MGEAEDITEGYRELYDAKREVFWPGATLTLILNAGTGDEEELEISGGWWPEKERRPTEVRSIYTVKVTARPELTAEIMGQADRLRLKGVLYQFTYDPPGAAPEEWVLYAEELKAGGMR